MQIVHEAYLHEGSSKVIENVVRCADPHDVVNNLCTNPSSWTDAFWYGMKHGHPKTFVNILNKFVEFPEIQCWKDMASSSLNRYCNFDVFVKHAPIRLLEMPQEVGGLPGSSLFIRDNIVTLMAYKEYTRIHLSGYYSPKTAGTQLYARIVECGGRIHVLHFLESLKVIGENLKLLEFVDCTLNEGAEYTTFINLVVQMLTRRRISGSRLSLLKALLKRIELPKADLEMLKRLFSVKKSDISLYNHIVKQLKQ